MSRLSIGVFSWNVAKLCEAVTALEKEGHHVTGYEIVKMVGYGSYRHDRLIFLEFAPDVLEAWRSKGDVGNPEIVMPDAPRKFGDPVPVEPPAPIMEDAPVRRRARKQDQDE